MRLLGTGIKAKSVSLNHSDIILILSKVITGSVKMVYAIIWSLFLGFAITLGRYAVTYRALLLVY